MELMSTFSTTALFLHGNLTPKAPKTVIPKNVKREAFRKCRDPLGEQKKKRMQNKISPQSRISGIDIAQHTKNFDRGKIKKMFTTQVRNVTKEEELPIEEAPIPEVLEAHEVLLNQQLPTANEVDAELAEDAIKFQQKHGEMDVDKDDRLLFIPGQCVSATSKENDVGEADEELTDMKAPKTITKDDKSMNVTEDVPQVRVNEVNEENAHPEDDKEQKKLKEKDVTEVNEVKGDNSHPENDAEEDKISPAECIDDEERGVKRNRRALHVDEDPTSPMKRQKENAQLEKKRKPPKNSESHHAGSDEPNNPKQMRKEKESPEQEKRRKRNESCRKRTRSEWEQAAENPELPVTAPEICSDTDGGKHDCRPPDKEYNLMMIIKWALAFYGSLVFTFLTSTVVVKCILVVSVSATGIAIYYLMITFKPVGDQHEKITLSPDKIPKKPPHENCKSVALRPKDDFKAKMIHRWVFFEIANYIPPKEDVYDKFVNFASIYLNPLEKSECKGVIGFLNKLEDKGIISIGNYKALLELENHGQHHHILDVIRKPEKYYNQETRSLFVA